jgi:hypothetical protein
MGRRNKVVLLFTCPCFLLCSIPNFLQAQQRLWFGTLKVEGRSSQARFEVDSSLHNIIYAPYGRTPIAFTNIKTETQQLTFNWQYNQHPYHCTLLKQKGNEYKGTCSVPGDKGQSIEITMREFTPEDADLQGNSLKASATDLQILDRALALLNNGSNWSRSDNRICDSSSYPYKWSLFCALHQASIDVATEYRHLRPAIQAARQAIDEATSGKKFAHMLQDFNKEAQNFASIAGVLNRAKEIIAEKMKSNPNSR